MKTKQPQFIFTSNSPIYTVNVHDMVDHEGNFVSLNSVTAICRCGHSKSLPYCDNSHDFKEQSPRLEGHSELFSEVAKFKFKTYKGEKISINFSSELCCHAGLCLKYLPSVFNSDKRPWIDASGAEVDVIIEAVLKCPSGALTYSISGQEYGYGGAIAGSESNDVSARIESDNIRRKISLINKGPLVVRGNVELIDDRNSLGRLHDHLRFSLCRCGKSENLPFCNGSHNEDVLKTD